jgi:hypothetical protein
MTILLIQFMNIMKNCEEKLKPAINSLCSPFSPPYTTHSTTRHIVFRRNKSSWGDFLVFFGASLLAALFCHRALRTKSFFLFFCEFFDYTQLSSQTKNNSLKALIATEKEKGR